MKIQNTWFVIVTYETEKETLRRLMGVVEEWPTEIVDNTKKNLGYGGAANKGMKRAFDAGAAWVIVCNQDVTLSKEGMRKFVKALERCDPGIVGPEAGNLDPKRWTTILASTASRPGLEAGRLDSRLRGNDNLSYISGSLMAIHRDVYEATGGFYEPYFMYYEDVDFCIRAKKAGFGLRQLDIDGFEHGSDESHVSDENNEKKKQKEYYLARNHLLFVFRRAPLSVKFYELVRLPKTIWESLW